MGPVAPRKGGLVRRLSRALSDAFAPPGVAGAPYLRVVRATGRVRLLIAISALAMTRAVPGTTPEQRRIFVLLVGLVYPPYAAAVFLLSRRSEELRSGSLLPSAAC
ncbi:MAG: hypothetical protein ACRDJ4_10430 [Actinomycetota bacterium]